jgi:hypothetical protein
MHQFKVAAADWTPEFSNPDRDTVPGVPIVLTSRPGATTNSRLSLTSDGCYAFALDATSTSSPVLIVTPRSLGGSDPDVLAFARTMAGQKSVVVVVNNDRADVDLAALPGGGIDVQGLLADGAVVEVTDVATSLRVTGGRLAGPVPALTALAVSQ